MAGGQGASRRANARRAQEKQKRKKEAKKAAKGLQIPTVTEDDLLAFQTSHFGDTTAPGAWFVDGETAVLYDAAGEDDDGLGWYEDGVKRTLTDSQIEMFRHSEIEALAREKRARRREEEEDEEEGLSHADPQDATAPMTDGKASSVAADKTLDEHEKQKGDMSMEPCMTAHASQPILERAESPASDASSLEEELSNVAPAARFEPRPPNLYRRPSERSRSGTSSSRGSQRKQRRVEVPYEQRKKRTWENFIESNDPVEGSLTHRRLVRELDDYRAGEKVELDY